MMGKQRRWYTVTILTRTTQYVETTSVEHAIKAVEEDFGADKAGWFLVLGAQEMDLPKRTGKGDWLDPNSWLTPKVYHGEEDADED